MREDVHFPSICSRIRSFTRLNVMMKFESVARRVRLTRNGGCEYDVARVPAFRIKEANRDTYLRRTDWSVIKHVEVGKKGNENGAKPEAFGLYSIGTEPCFVGFFWRSHPPLRTFSRLISR
jgi:hypothetical protein